MKPWQIVLDTNVFVSALRSRGGASFKLLSLIGGGRFQLNVSVPLVLEYEDAAKRADLALTEKHIDDVLDYVCHVANRREIFFLWRPWLKDPKDDFILELAVEAACDFIVTFNLRDFAGSEKFGVRVITPREFLRILGETK